MICAVRMVHHVQLENPLIVLDRVQFQLTGDLMSPGSYSTTTAAAPSIHDGPRIMAPPTGLHYCSLSAVIFSGVARQRALKA